MKCNKFGFGFGRSATITRAAVAAIINTSMGVKHMMSLEATKNMPMSISVSFTSG